MGRAQLRLGRKLHELKRQDEAESVLALVDSLAPSSSDVFLERGQFRLELNQRDKAIADFSKALEVEPNHVAGRIRRAEVFIDLALWPEAAADFARAFQLEEPADSLTFLLHAILRRCVDDGPGYRDACQRMLARFADSTNPDDWSCMARALVLSPEPGVEPSRAVAFAERAVADNKRTDRVAHVGLAHYRAGEFERAVTALEESLALDANLNPVDVHSVLAMALHRLGRKGQARAALDRLWWISGRF